jgi:hypothetical protein
LDVGDMHKSGANAMVAEKYQQRLAEADPPHDAT